MTSQAGKRILFATAECAPWVKTGGLGEVSGDLPLALSKLGYDIRVLMPLYQNFRHKVKGLRKCCDIEASSAYPASRLMRATLPNGICVLLLDCPELYDRPGTPYLEYMGGEHPDNDIRFGLLSYVAALLSSDQSPLKWRADLLHCNDWHTGLAPAYLKWVMKAPAPSVMTLHNLAYQGHYPLERALDLGLPKECLHIEGVEFWGKLSFLKAGLYYADFITTVSPTYALEIQTSEDLGCGLQGLLLNRRQQLKGILNGVDLDKWTTTNNPHLAASYDFNHLDGKHRCKEALQKAMGLKVDDQAFLIGMVTRLYTQKGIDWVLESLDPLMEHDNIQFAILGSGDPALEEAWKQAASRYLGRIAIYIGFNEPLSHQIEAGADVFLMPSRFEPCGLNQMYSQIYGTPPIVHATGGLADSVIDANARQIADKRATGFTFHEASAQAMRSAIDTAYHCHQQKDLWTQIQRNGMAMDFSWAKSAEYYVEIYHRLIQPHEHPSVVNV